MVMFSKLGRQQRLEAFLMVVLAALIILFLFVIL